MLRRRKHPVCYMLAGMGVMYLCAIAAFGLNAQPHPADLAVVLGNDVRRDGSPEPRLKARLDCAVALYRNHVVPRILASGGIEANGMDEAGVMARYLIRQGVPASAVQTDSNGKNTMATAVNTAASMRREHLSNVIIVTQYFHIPRCMLAFRRAGIHGFSAAYPAFYEGRDLYSLAREAVALPYYLFRAVSA